MSFNDPKQEFINAYQYQRRHTEELRVKHIAEYKVLQALVEDGHKVLLDSQKAAENIIGDVTNVFASEIQSIKDLRRVTAKDEKMCHRSTGEQFFDCITGFGKDRVEISETGWHWLFCDGPLEMVGKSKEVPFPLLPFPYVVAKVIAMAASVPPKAETEPKPKTCNIEDQEDENAVPF